MLKNVNKEGFHLVEEEETAKGPEKKQLDMLPETGTETKKRKQLEKSQVLLNIQ